jgi:hypothetical protein
MAKRDGRQKGPQAHAEGQHGSKTHHAFIRELRGRQASGEDERGDFAEPLEEPREPPQGSRRLTEDRQQHDAAERDSEVTRASRAKKREGGPDSG